MHELPVTQGMLSIAVEHAERAGAEKITAINITVGEMSGIVDDSIQFYFDFVSKDTPAEGALLNFERVTAKIGIRLWKERDINLQTHDLINAIVDAGDKYEIPRQLEPRGGEKGPMRWWVGP